MPDLPIHILGQAAHMREVEDDPVEAAFLDFFAAFVQLRRVDAVQNTNPFFGLELPCRRGRLWIFLQ